MSFCPACGGPTAQACKGHLVDVLIVDDDDDLRSSLAGLLEDSGFAVARVRDGQEALSYLERHPVPAAMVLDVMMPGMSALRLRDEVCSLARLRNLHVVLFTAANDRHLGRLGLSCDQVLRKPNDVSALIARIETVVRQRCS